MKRVVLGSNTSQGGVFCFIPLTAPNWPCYSSLPGSRSATPRHASRGLIGSPAWCSGAGKVCRGRGWLRFLSRHGWQAHWNQTVRPAPLVPRPRVCPQIIGRMLAYLASPPAAAHRCPSCQKLPPSCDTATQPKLSRGRGGCGTQ